jgi:hypothetical protein
VGVSDEIMSPGVTDRKHDSKPVRYMRSDVAVRDNLGNYCTLRDGACRPIYVLDARKHACPETSLRPKAAGRHQEGYDPSQLRRTDAVNSPYELRIEGFMKRRE